MDEKIFVILVYSGVWLLCAAIGFGLIRQFEKYYNLNWNKKIALKSVFIALICGPIGLFAGLFCGFYHDDIQRNKNKKKPA